MAIYCYSIDEEAYHELGDFNSHEDALTEAKQIDSEVMDAGVVWIAVKKKVRVESLIPDIADRWLEDAGERAGEEYGDFADDWPRQDIPEEKIDELDRALKAVFEQWLRQNSPVHFWSVEEIRRFNF